MNINDYLYQNENFLNARQDCSLTIDLINYTNKDNISIDKEEKTIWVKSLISSIVFEDIEFDVILDYPIIIHADNMKIKEKEYIKLHYPKNTTILEASLEVEDIKKRINYTQRLLGGNEVNASINHLLLKMYDEFKTTDMDLVHLEILISNVARDKGDVSKPARLNKDYNPTLMNIKDVVFKGSNFVSSVSFENINKSITYGLISDVDEEPSILEKVMTGTIIKSK